MIPFAYNSNAESAPVVNCQQTRVDTRHVKIVCNAAGLIVLNSTVQLPVVEIPVPGPTSTSTITLPPHPGPTKYVTLPPETHTMTAPSQTKTVRATETKTITAAPQPVPSAGQQPTESVTIGPGPNHGFFDFPDNPEEAATTAGIGVLLALIVALIALWLGYIFGYKDAEKADVKYLKALRDKMYVRKH
jgi:hypothetical protein